MKTAEQWQEELAGETSVESIRRIQNDAMISAAQIARDSLYTNGRRDEGRMAQRAILDEVIL